MEKFFTVATYNFNLIEFGRNFKNENAVFEEMWMAMDELENAPMCNFRDLFSKVDNYFV